MQIPGDTSLGGAKLCNGRDPALPTGTSPSSVEILSKRCKQGYDRSLVAGGWSIPVRRASALGGEHMGRRKSVSIVTCTTRTAETFRRQLDPVFGAHVDFQICSLQSGNVGNICGDVVVVPGPKWARRVGKSLNRDVPVVVARRTLERSGLEKVMSLPSESKAMLVNNEEEAAFETTSLLYELGVRHVELVPVYPGSHVPELDTAITPNEVDCVPSRVRQVINIGDRVIDPGTIIEIAARMGEEHVDLSQVLERLGQAATNPWLVRVLEQSAGTREQLEIVLSLVPEAVLVLGAHDEVTLINREACRILGRDVLGRSLRDILPFDARWDNATLLNEPFLVNDTKYMVNKIPVRAGQSGRGGVVILKEAHELRDADGRARKASNHGYVAKYTFDDIAGTSPAIRHAVQMAKRFAQRKSPVLITGSSGTGKEFFANAIHNCSDRRAFPFVAVNCSAIPESLLESELFGYEEGAFTGARKGGKPGLFEQADRGTVFLDEIGDLSPALQARLLRVLQEKEVIRVGGTGVRTVDIRVICATNKDLKRLVEDGAFRSDLFYRISVLTLNLPDLRERLEDIPDLILAMLKKRNEPRNVPQEVLKVLSSYCWPGNIRELDNCVEYMLSVSDTTIGLRHLPPHILEAAGIHVRPDAPLGRPAQEALAVLQAVRQLSESGQSTGRRSITDLLLKRGQDFGEARVRRIIRSLRDQGFVLIGPGRSGVALTPEGARLLCEID